MGIQITGLEELKGRLKAAPTLLTQVAATAADRAAGVIGAAVEAKAEGLTESGSNTPLAEHVIVTTEVDAKGRGIVSTVGFDSSTDERTGIPQDLKAFLVEYGHRMVTHRPGHKDVGEVDKHPFIRPAFENSLERAIDVFADTLIENLSVIEEGA